MKAAVLYKPYDIRLEDVETPRIRADQVLVRVRAVGICGSDVHYYRTGRAGVYVVKEPIILGHECSGEIAEIGSDVEGFKPGDRVVIEPGFPCRRCSYCKSGRYNLCENMQFYGTPPVNGAFCEYIAADADFVYKMPENLTFEEGSMIEPLSVGIHATRRGHITVEDTVTILGAGPIGLLALQAVRARGVTTVYVTDIQDYLLEHAKRLGASETINARREDPVRRIMELTDGKGTDVVIEAVGSVETGRQTFEIVKRGGRIVIIGVFPKTEFAVRMTDFVDKELTVCGVFRYTNTYPTALKLVSAGKIELKSLITHVFTLDEIHKAMEVAEKKIGNPVKVIVKP